MYKLIVSDMDGTLLNEKDSISAKNKITISKLIDKGYIFTIATGRVFTSAKIYANELGIKAPIIACNGAIIRDLHDNNILFQDSISPKDCLKIFNLSKEYDVFLTFYSEDTYYAERLGKNVIKYVEYNKKISETEKVNIEIIEDPLKWYSENQHIKILKIQTNGDNPNALRAIRTELEKIHSISCSTSWSTNVEIMNKHVSKGAAVKQLAEIMNIKNTEIICFGDNENDISMFKYANIGISMANSNDFVKQNSDFVTLSNNDDGVSYGINKFISL